LQMARRTDWLALPGSGEGDDAQFRGLGQRVLTTDRGDRGLLEVRSLHLDAPAAG